ncbi:MAG: hypothetical protein LBU35_00790, partial [Holosporales bacterium]|nr:hypothetical protein [Holosporales bacterium]
MKKSTSHAFFAITICHFNFSYAALTEIEKYEKWREAIETPADYEKVFLFFYKNPHWPLFEESVKIAERNIKLNTSNKITLTWFKKYKPKTANGVKLYTKILLKAFPKVARKYIKQTWIFQNV